eukprot:TRINITY_DN66835_c0_g1_i1.p1 TRINITY_DN66835_c0_g1~~TRINITY_DN66835_c0_g1_i1.p1  ORF type:complete len:306 (-),score=21.75 TRINITY_DN66835_c0_g1_i1:103-1020(-)
MADSNSTFSCCTERQVIFFLQFSLFFITGLVLWKSRIILPLKLFGTLAHELSHAAAAFMCCAKVTGIEVHADKSGLCRWSSDEERLTRIQHFVLPAGYTGSVIWGGLILMCCANNLSAEICAICLILLSVVALLFNWFGKVEVKDRTLTYVCIGLIVLLTLVLCLCWLTAWTHRYIILESVLLMISAVNTLDATYTLLDQCVFRYIDGSDAVRFAELWCGKSFCLGRSKIVGMYWFFVSIVTIIGCAFLSLLLVYSPQDQWISNSVFPDVILTWRLGIPFILLVAASMYRLVRKIQSKGSYLAKE